MRLIGFLCVLLLSKVALAQNGFRELRPAAVDTLNLSAEREAKFIKDRRLYAVVDQKLRDGAELKNLTAEEQRVWGEIDETQEDYWDILGGGCSWYCGGGAKEITASSTLKQQGATSYEPKHAEDLSYKTAWVEGAAGYGIGEYLLYKFTPEAPRITDIKVVNGYVKNKRAYTENSRVKKLKVYLNDQPYAVFNLADTPSVQTFTVAPIGNGNRADFDKLLTQPGWTLKFEIADVYKGTKYDDTVITEIYFDGVDVH